MKLNNLYGEKKLMRLVNEVVLCSTLNSWVGQECPLKSVLVGTPGNVDHGENNHES